MPSPVVDPYSPAPQSAQDPHPDSEYLPSGQMAAIGLVDPDTHAYPALQFPTHDDAT